MKRLWTCSACLVRFDYAQTKPAITAPACVWYGDFGRPPFVKSNQVSGRSRAPLLAMFFYCARCAIVSTTLEQIASYLEEAQQ